MKNKEFEILNKEFIAIENEADDIEFDELEDRVFKFEEKLIESLDSCFEEDLKSFQGLMKKLNRLKKDNDFYDAEGELDRMFPNRNDENFDEDSMSYDSVFGDD